MKPDERKEYAQKLFDYNKRNVFITNGTSYASFTINTDAEDIEDKKKKILSKLSKEEIELLGIKSE